MSMKVRLCLKLLVHFKRADISFSLLHTVFYNRSLFDFTDYIAAHPMTTTPDTSITGFKNIGIMEYPDSHPMSYFEDLKAEEGVLIKSLARYVYATTSRVNQNARYGDKMTVDQFSQMIGISNDRVNLLAVADNLGRIMLSNQIVSRKFFSVLISSLHFCELTFLSRLHPL